MAKTLDKAAIQALYGVNGLEPLLILDRWRVGLIHAVQGTQEDRCPKERATYGLANTDCAHIPRRAPLIGEVVPAQPELQNLQRGLSSSVACGHVLDTILPKMVELLILHVWFTSLRRRFACTSSLC